MQSIEKILLVYFYIKGIHKLPLAKVLTLNNISSITFLLCEHERERERERQMIILKADKMLIRIQSSYEKNSENNRVLAK
jgi:hypothetical protein